MVSDICNLKTVTWLFWRPKVIPDTWTEIRQSIIWLISLSNELSDIWSNAPVAMASLTQRVSYAQLRRTVRCVYRILKSRLPLFLQRVHQAEYIFWSKSISSTSMEANFKHFYNVHWVVYVCQPNRQNEYFFNISILIP